MTKQEVVNELQRLAKASRGSLDKESCLVSASLYYIAALLSTGREEEAAMALKTLANQHLERGREQGRETL